MERKRDDGVKEVVTESAPETDPSASKEEKQGGGRG